MYSNLRKNIFQIEREISNLEKDCRNMETRGIKKNGKSESVHCKPSRNSNLQPKAPKARVSVKKNDGLKKNIPTPPRSSKVQSCGSMKCQCSKSWNDSSGTSIDRNAQSYRANNYLQGCTGQKINQAQCNLKKDYKTRNSDCNKAHFPDLGEGDKMYGSLRDHVLHKEVLSPSSGSTIEVIVTRKCKSKENSPIVNNRNITSAKEKNNEGCKCQTKGPKWSEILYLESAKNKVANDKNYAKRQTLTGVENLKSPSVKFDTRVVEENFNLRNNFNQTTDEATYDIPVKLSPELYRNPNMSETNRRQFSEIQHCENHNGAEKRSQSHLEAYNKNSPVYSPRRDFNEKLNSPKSPFGLNTEFLCKIQENCENLKKEKEKLAEELTTKESTLEAMRKREEDYVSVISNLKSAMIKLRGQVEKDVKLLKEFRTVEAELTEQKKISEDLKKRHLTLQNMFERNTLENHKLQTQIKLLKLEAQKHDVLLAGKDAEINKYRDELKNFQRQLCEHMQLLKSNSQGVNAENMMESIIHQSQLLFRSDLKSVSSEDNLKDSSKTIMLMHSSPTSTKTSRLNSSWNAISSIHEGDCSKNESDFVMNVKREDNSAKEFYQIFGYSSSGSKSPESPNSPDSPEPAEPPETLVEKSSDKKKLKNSCSFTSCLSLREENDFSDCKTDFVPEKRGSAPDRDAKTVELRKVQSNIDVLLKSLKSKWSKGIFESSAGDNTTINDFLDGSQISSMTQ